MSDDATRGGPDEPDGIDTGRPVDVLRDLDQDVSGGFLGGIRRKIERKVLTSQVATATWHLPLVVVLEFLKLVAQVFGSASDDKGDSRDGKTD